VEFAKHSKRENRVYVGNLSYDVKYRDLIEFMRGGGWGRFNSWPFLVFFSVVMTVLSTPEVVAVMQGREGAGLDTADELWTVVFVFPVSTGP
jgi:hypothetical protein